MTRKNLTLEMIKLVDYRAFSKRLQELTKLKFCGICSYGKVQVGKDQEKALSAKDSHSKNPRWEKTKLTIRYLYHENIS